MTKYFFTATEGSEGSKPKPSSSSLQTGAGEHSNDVTLKTSLMKDNVFLDSIVAAVSKKLSPRFEPTTDNWIFYDRARPTVSSQPIPEDTTPPPHFDNKVVENDLNDAFDENQLLKFVPKRFKEKAKTLLQIFDEKPNEITWDSAGVIYVNQTSIPDSNIYTLFPYLFRQKVPKDILNKGFPDFLKKVIDMNLGHLLNCNIRSILGNPSLKIKNESSLPLSNKWWKLT